MTVCVENDYVLVDQQNPDPSMMRNMMWLQYPPPQLNLSAGVGFSMAISEPQAFEPVMTSDELFNYADWVDCEASSK